MSQLKFRYLIITVLFIVIFSTSRSFSQYQFGGFFGMSDYSGDLANTPLDFKRESIGGGAYAGYYLDKYFQVRGRITYQNVKAHDSDQKTTASRNLSFESDIIEFAAILNFEYDEFASTDYRFKPFVYIGAGLYKYNPKAEVNGSLVELQPLGTEGQGIPGYGTPYRLTDIVVPFGGGLKYQLLDEMIVELDFGAKKVFTDYLDDVSGQEYVAPSILIQNGQTAVDAAYKADEIGGLPYSAFENPAVRASNPRNISRKHDWYYLFSVGASYYLPINRRSEIYKNRKGVPNSY